MSRALFFLQYVYDFFCVGYTCERRGVCGLCELVFWRMLNLNGERDMSVLYPFFSFHVIHVVISVCALSRNDI